METKYHDLIVLGGGPGGYVAAIRAAQLGQDVACVDANDIFGGTCLRVGCIPSKAMLESSEKFHETQAALAQHGIHVGEVELDLAAMLERKTKIVRSLGIGINSLFKKNKITPYQGFGTFEEPGRLIVESADGSQVRLEAENIIIATGSRPAMLPGIEPDGKHIGTSTEALSYSEVPQHLVVIGAGYIGLELGSVWHRLGSEVTLIEALDRILPGTDDELATAAHRIFEKQGLQFRLGAKVQDISVKRGRCTVSCDTGEPIKCDQVLVCIGRRPATDTIGLENADVECDRRGFIVINENYETSCPGIFAIGDCVPGPMLAHKASVEGIACVEALYTGYGHVNYDAIPGVAYTHPEIATVGPTEAKLKEDGIPYKKSKFPMIASGRAKTIAETDGFVKMLAHAETDRLLGVHILAARAGDLIAEAAAAISFGASSEDLGRVCHAHPTLSETLGEAAHGILSHAVHG